MANYPASEQMTQTQWERAKEITADALERDPSTRASFVDEACGNDAEVRHEVLRLLVEDRNSDDDFLSAPLLNLRNFIEKPGSGLPCFSPEQVVAGRFRIERFLSRGGMGEVYAATDLELQESVALKTISPAIASSADVIARFKSEVKESRRITHPSVCRIYDLFSHHQAAGEQTWFLTMELLEGRTLGDALLGRGPLPLHQAIPLIADMVGALSAAHELGIVHRDFKPSNVMLVRGGAGSERAVVTDFGLALNLSWDQGRRGATAGDGTPAYMAPEQAAGGDVGFTVDQFALGLVICEMLTGSRPKLARLSAEESRRQLREWLKQQPARKLNARTRRAVRRCLAFRAADRFRHVRDVIPVIDGTRQHQHRRWAASVVAVVSTLALALVVAAPAAGPHVIDAIPLTSEAGLAASPAVSRDGKWVVYMSDRAESGNLDIWLQPAAGGQAKRLTTHPGGDSDPTISSDGKLVAFRSERDGGGIYIVSADGSGERLLVAGGRSPVFSPDGRWVAFWLGSRDDAAPSGQIYVISPEGGHPRRLAADFADARYPTWNFTGQFLLFEGCRANTAALSTCADWWVMRADGTEARNTGAVEFLRSQSIEVQTPPLKTWRGDQVIFSGAQGTTIALWALKLSPQDLRPSGSLHRITSGDAKEREPAVAETGAIAFGRITGSLHLWRLPLKRSDATPATRVTDDPSLDGCPSVSHDGRWLFFTRKIRDVRQLLVRDLAAGRESVVFASEDQKFWPIGTQGGEKVAFEVRHAGDSSIWLTERGGQVRRLCSGCSHPTSWFAGDKALFYTTANGAIALVDVATGASRVVLSPENGVVLGGADWSPSTEYLLFTGGRQGAEKQLFGIKFPAVAAQPQGPRVQLTQESAELDPAHWSSEGNAFYFLSKRDGYSCVWGRLFSAAPDRRSDSIFPVMHFHDSRLTPSSASPIARGLTVAGDAIYLNVGEVTDTLWIGKLTDPGLFSRIRGILFRR